MPKRKAPPRRVKDKVRQQQDGKCGCRKRCGKRLPPDGKGLVQYQHEPALELREVLADDSDWSPGQHDPRYLYAEMAACHKKETYHPRSLATSLGSDRHAIDKVKRIRGETCTGPRKRIPSKPFVKAVKPWPKGAKLQSRPFQRRPT